MFTVVTDFDGGTYVSQVDEGNDPNEALKLWVGILRLEEFIPDRSPEIANLIERDLEYGFSPVALDELRDVWQYIVTLDSTHCTVTLVQSVD